MSIRTSIMIDLSLIFDNDTDTGYVKEQIGLSIAENKDKRDTRISPFKNDNLPGYWSIITGYIETNDLDEVSEKLLDIICPCLEKIKKAQKCFVGRAKFMVVVKIVDNIPSLYFSRKFLDVVEYLGAEIDVDIYAELA